MGADRLSASVDNTRNLYDFMAILFKFLDGEDFFAVKSSYDSYMKESDSRAEKQLDSLMELLEEYLYFGFEEWRDAWKRIYEENNSEEYHKEYIVPLRTLRKIDDHIRPLILSKDSYRIRIGPLNNADSEYLLFLKKPKGFFRDSFSEGKIRIGRNTISYSTDSCNTYFKSISFIKKDYLMGYRPEVYYYRTGVDGLLSSNKSVKVAFATFLKEPWFLPRFDDNTNCFEVLTDVSKTSLIHTAFKQILKKCDSDGAEIVVFPELSMQPSTEDVVRELFLDTTFRNLKLCFLGSVWQNHANTSLLMTSSGTVLAKQGKKQPYKHYSKERKKAYRESITVSDKKVMMIDIDGIGRIAYYICADINAGEIKTLSEVMQVDFIFVSAYTTKTVTMYKSAVGKAQVTGTATVLCNAAAATIVKDGRKSLQAFCIIPKVDDKELKCEEVTAVMPARASDFSENDWSIYYSEVKIT